MKSIVQVINDTIKPAGAECLSSDRVNLDYDRHREYLDSQENRASDIFENPLPRSRTLPVSTIDDSIPSILRYFLDGSRRTYKMADLLVRGRYLPLIAGQVGGAVVIRQAGESKVQPVRDLCSIRNALAFPGLVTTQE